MNAPDDGNYLFSVSYFDGSTSIHAYEILKRTDRFVWVKHYSKSFRLDRAELEAKGSIYAKKACCTLYTTRREAESQLDPAIVAEMHRTGEDSLDPFNVGTRLG